MKVLSVSKAIILSSKKILLFQRDNNPTIRSPECWQLPGGGIEEGETPRQALTRELVEEVGFAPPDPIFLKKIIGSQGEDVYLYVIFIKDEEEQKFRWGGGEGQGAGFFTIDEALKLKLTPGTIILFTDYREIVERLITTRKVPKNIKVKDRIDVIN